MSTYRFGAILFNRDWTWWGWRCAYRVNLRIERWDKPDA